MSACAISAEHKCRNFKLFYCERVKEIASAVSSLVVSLKVVIAFHQVFGNKY